MSNVINIAEATKNVNNLKIGTVLYFHGYNNDSNVIVKRHEGSRVFYDTINLSTYTRRRQDTLGLQHISEKQDNRISVYVTDEVYTADQLMDVFDNVRAVEVKKIQEADQKEAREKEETANLRKEYSHLALVDPAKYNGRVVGAKNIRKELKIAFPGVKFSVRGSSFSMGNSIDISWKDESVKAEDVDKIIDKYQEGSFDGMTDCYNYGNSMFNTLFGGAKYVHSQFDRF